MVPRTQPDPGSRGRRRKALLAGGAILGLGAAATLAAWTDDVWVSATFTTDTFDVQGFSDTTEGWDDHPSDESVAVFQPAIGTVVPGSTRSYSRFGLRMAPGSTVGATVAIPSGVEFSPTPQADKFHMRIVVSSTCDAGAFTTGTADFVVGTAETYYSMLSPPTGISTVTLNKGPSSAEPGTPVFLCYEFSLPLPIPRGLSNGAEATVRWTFDAESL
ncbi:MAG: SipW-dependent-type signal peptide-containing protein [Dietzia maris]